MVRVSGCVAHLVGRPYRFRDQAQPSRVGGGGGDTSAPMGGWLGFVKTIPRVSFFFFFFLAV